MKGITVSTVMACEDFTNVNKSDIMLADDQKNEKHAINEQKKKQKNNNVSYVNNTNGNGG